MVRCQKVPAEEIRGIGLRGFMTYAHSVAIHSENSDTPGEDEALCEPRERASAILGIVAAFVLGLCVVLAAIFAGSRGGYGGGGAGGGSGAAEGGGGAGGIVAIDGGGGGRNEVGRSSISMYLRRTGGQTSGCGFCVKKRIHNSEVIRSGGR